jgi:uncharacterized protein YfaS (alpha-2-macroglobulin family)
MIVTAALASVMIAGPAGVQLSAAPEERVKMAELSPAVESAIDNALKCLASRQNKDGGFGTSDYKVGVTAVSLMAFMLKGHFPKRGQYGVTLDRGLEYLLKKSKDGAGYMGSSMYEHGLATLALSEAWGMSDRDEIRDALKRAVEVIIQSQNDQGGWRYNPRPQDADLSVTVMQIMALSSAKEAGILVPSTVIDNAVRYVKSLQVRLGGGFGYADATNPAMSRSAAGVLSLIMCGERNSSAVQRGLEYLKRLPESKFKTTDFYYYAHYYSIQAMYQAGETYYQEWYPKIRDALLESQAKDGHFPGGEAGDECYSTSMSVLILGVPYRFLPIYQR